MANYKGNKSRNTCGDSKERPPGRIVTSPFNLQIGPISIDVQDCICCEEDLRRVHQVSRSEVSPQQKVVELLRKKQKIWQQCFGHAAELFDIFLASPGHPLLLAMPRWLEESLVALWHCAQAVQARRGSGSCLGPKETPEGTRKQKTENPKEHAPRHS